MLVVLGGSGQAATRRLPHFWETGKQMRRHPSVAAQSRHYFSLVAYFGFLSMGCGS